VALEQDGIEAPGGVGARLRGARERAGLSPIEAAERLHLDTVVLHALEADRFEQLGAPVYVRGYIRHYADLVKESPAELEDLYGASAHAGHPPDLTHIPRAERERFSRTLLAPGIVIVVAVALLGMGWWIAGTLSRGVKVRRVAVAAIVSPAPDTKAAATGTASRTAPRSRAAAQSLPSAASSIPKPLPATSPPPTSAASPAAATASLAMHFSQDSWTEVYDATGKRLFYNIGMAGSTRTVTGVPPMRVVLGNAPAVSLELDGRPVAVPGIARNKLAEFRVSASGQVARLWRRRPAAGTKPGANTLAGAGTAESQDSRP
jgi:cytoskeleton protein RodZ